VELRQLRYFVAVAEELHFRRAAERLHVSQPPLSTQIRKLEADVGVELLRRNRRGVELTVAGRTLLADARLLLEHADRATERARRAARGELGELRIGFVGSAIYAVLPEAVRTFRGRRPEVHISLRELPTEDQIEALRRDQIDVGFIRMAAAPEDLRMERVLREPVVAALPADHRLAAERAVGLGELDGESFVLFPRAQAPEFHDELTARLRHEGITARIAQEAPEMQTIIGLVAAGVGVSLVPASTRMLAREGIVYRPLRDDELTAWLTVATRAGDDSPVVAGFLDVARVAGREAALRLSAADQ
jgi:DNA-binding transcriptional LysR family regulator